MIHGIVGKKHIFDFFLENFLGAGLLPVTIVCVVGNPAPHAGPQSHPVPAPIWLCPTFPTPPAGRKTMLSILDRASDRNCQGFCRREFLKIGGLGLLGGLTLPGLLASRAHGAGGYGSRKPITGKSVVLLFLQGGPSHIE